MGAVGIAWTGNPIYMGTMNNVYIDNLAIGEAFRDAYVSSNYRYMTTILGDPTLELNPQYMLSEPLTQWS
tara:strand:+ start:98 stop:307 length:210 start_codon:yes stop_codon:yes gene_type:complete